MFDKKIRVPASFHKLLTEVLPTGLYEGDGFLLDFSGVKRIEPDWDKGRLAFIPPAKVEIKGMISATATVDYLEYTEGRSYVYLEIGGSPIDIRIIKEDE